jgi:hypothetical protein
VPQPQCKERVYFRTFLGTGSDSAPPELCHGSEPPMIVSWKVLGDSSQTIAGPRENGFELE